MDSISLHHMKLPLSRLKKRVQYRQFHMVKPNNSPLLSSVPLHSYQGLFGTLIRISSSKSLKKLTSGLGLGPTFLDSQTKVLSASLCCPVPKTERRPSTWLWALESPHVDGASRPREALAANEQRPRVAPGGRWAVRVPGRVEEPVRQSQGCRASAQGNRASSTRGGPVRGKPGAPGELLLNYAG